MSREKIRVTTPELGKISHKEKVDFIDLLPGNEDVDYQDNHTPKHRERNLSKQVFVEAVYEKDAYSKSLTGRTPERIEKETGIPKNEIFPPDKKILYVGDPWQRMGLERDTPDLTIIDYEYGDVAAFVKDDRLFRENIRCEADYLLKAVNDMEANTELDDKQLEWLRQFKQLIADANAISVKAERLNYPEAAAAWANAREFLERTYRQEIEIAEEELPKDVGDPDEDKSDLAIFRTDAWYTCVAGERGFRDILDYENIIKPHVEAKRQELEVRGFQEEELEKLLARWEQSYIEDIRLKKKPEQANVVEAVFPDLPFKAKSFDRFVASWSISAHVFGELDEDGFLTTWKEINRVLKNQGEAHIFPLNYSYIDDTAFTNSLEMFCKTNNLSWEILDKYGAPVDETSFAFTLHLIKH